MTRGAESPWWAESGPPDAPLVVLIHGTMDRSAGMLRLSRRLDRDLRVLRYDRRGYGRSRPHPGPFGLDDQLGDLVGLLAGRRAALFGHSYGGNIALALGERRPDLVDSLAVYETPLSWFDWWPGTTAGGNALATQGEPAEAAERFMRRLIGDERWERLPASTRDARRAEGAAMVGELTDLRLRPAWTAERVQRPVLALYGERGAPHHQHAMAFLAEHLPACRLERIDGARHFGPNTHADAVAAALVDHVRLGGTVFES
jgi:pimeloyl-ACP methyl ester carboxylesterase